MEVGLCTSCARTWSTRLEKLDDRLRKGNVLGTPAAASVGLLGHMDGHVDRIGQGEARGLQTPGADAGETIGELVVAGLWHDHFDRREPDPVAPAELRPTHIGEQGDEIPLGRTRVLRRQLPDEIGRASCRERVSDTV